MLGFPIPAKVGGQVEKYHWQALLLPTLSHGHPNGFSPTEKGYLLRDRTCVFTRDMRLDWRGSKNWDPAAITARGRLSTPLASKKILVIGAGAVGAMISEMLARAGCKSLVILDGDRLEVGNLCRHTLLLDDVFNNKAVSVASRIQRINPHLKVVAIDTAFPPANDDCEIVIDCTADDTLLSHLAAFNWQGNRLFFSISLGLRARRMFFFSAQGESFPHSTFFEKTGPLIEEERKDYEGVEFPSEGIGCWHPVFPARADDIWMMASVAVKHMEEITTSPDEAPHLQLFEQIYDGTQFQGIRKIEP